MAVFKQNDIVHATYWVHSIQRRHSCPLW